MDSYLLLSHISSAAIFVFLMQKLKAASWFPWVNKEGQIWTKRISSFVYAFCAQTGISHVWGTGPSTLPGSHVLLITIPALSVIAVSLWHNFNQFVLQELIYRAVPNGNGAPAPAVPAAPVAPAPKVV
jgi:hypothetical protein